MQMWPFTKERGIFCLYREKAESTIDSEGFKGGTRGAPIMPRVSVSRTANVERTGRHKWVKGKANILVVWNWISLKPVLYRRCVDDTFLLFKSESHIQLFSD